MIIDEDDYVDYNVGAVFPEGLFYKPDQGLVIFGQDEGEGVERTQLVINPNLLQGTVRIVNLFDEDKGELNPDLYDQMALPDGMSFDRQTGLVLSGISKEGNPIKELVINPNSISSERLNLLNVDTNKIDASISTLPTGLTYSQKDGLEIEGATTGNSLVINPKGLPTKTSLFESSSEETSTPKINSHLYESDSRLPLWVTFDDTNRTIKIEGFPQKTSEDDEPTGLAPILHINAGAIKQNVYIIADDTGFLKAELPDGMFFDRVSGLTLWNNSGGSIRIPVGDSKISKEYYLLDFFNFDPTNPSVPLQNYYPAINIPTYIKSGQEVYMGISGFYYNDSSASSSYITTIGGKEIILKKVVDSKTTNLINVTEDGVDPSTIASGIDASKITTGTLTNIPITSNKSIEINNDVLTLSNQNGIQFVGTGSIFKIQPNGNIQYTIKDSSNVLDINPTVGIQYTGSESIFQIKSSGDLQYTYNQNENQINIDSTRGIFCTNLENTIQILPKGDIQYRTLNSGNYMDINNEVGIKYSGTKSVFQVYPSGNMRLSVNNSDRYVQIFDGTIEIVKNNLLYFFGGGGTYGNSTKIYGGGYLMDTWAQTRPSSTTNMVCSTNVDRTPSNPE